MHYYSHHPYYITSPFIFLDLILGAMSLNVYKLEVVVVVVVVVVAVVVVAGYAAVTPAIPWESINAT
jgi:hypothetical protein